MRRSAGFSEAVPCPTGEGLSRLVQVVGSFAGSLLVHSLFSDHGFRPQWPNDRQSQISGSGC